MIQLILKNMKNRKIQTFAVFFSVLISVAVLFALLLVHSGISAGIAISEQRLGADLVAIPEAAESSVDDDDLLFGGTAANYYMDTATLDEIAQINGVKRVTPQFFCQTLIGSACCSDGLAARIVGFDPETDWAIKPWMQDNLSGELASDDIIVGADIVATEGDDKINVLGRTFHIVGRMDKTGTSLDYSLMMGIDAARDLAHQKEDYAYLWRQYGDPANLITAALIELEDDANEDAVATLVAYKTDTAVIEAQHAINDVQQQMDVVLALMFGAALLLAAATVIQLFARFYTMTWDRRSEFGLYRALGAKRGELRGLIMGEMTLLVVAGSVLGIAVGCLLYTGVLGLLDAQGSFPFTSPSLLEGTLFACALVAIMLIIGFAACAFPAHQINRISPTLAMHRGNID